VLRFYKLGILFLIIGGTGVTAQCFKSNFAFKAGERLDFTVYYNWGFIWINAGIVNFNVDEALYNGRKVYFFDANGSTHKSYDWFFKVRDNFQAYIDMETLKPLWHKRDTYEDGYQAYEEYQFKPDCQKIVSETKTSNRAYKKDTLNYKPCTFDVLSLTYYARNLDFSKLKKDDTIPLSVLLDNEIYSLYIRYLGKEDLKTKEGEKYHCIKFSAKLVEGTIFKGGEDLFVWVTDDKNRIPVLVEAKILVGSVKAMIYTTENLRNEMTAKFN
jgi:hypothetical protein